MSNLGDYIGQIMAEITLARMQADLEAVKVADYYASHPLLKTFPVPRFRLPRVTVDVAVAVKEVQSPPTPGAPLKSLNKEKAQEVFVAALREQVKQSGFALSESDYQQMQLALGERFSGMNVPDFVSASVVHFADIGVNAVEKNLPAKTFKGDARLKFTTNLRERALVALVKLLPVPARIRVVTNSAEMREMGPTEYLTHIQLNITEQGVEWRGDEGKDGGSRKLLPE